MSQLAGREPTTPTPLEVTRAPDASRDLYRALRERLAALQGSAKQAQVCVLSIIIVLAALCV